MGGMGVAVGAAGVGVGAGGPPVHASNLRWVSLLRREDDHACRPCLDEVAFPEDGRSLIGIRNLANDTHLHVAPGPAYCAKHPLAFRLPERMRDQE